MIKSFFQRGSPLLALSNPEKIKMTADGMNMHGWVLRCTDKSLSSSAGSATRPCSLAPCIPSAPRGSALLMRAALTVRRSARREEQSQQRHHRGFGFRSPPCTAFVAGCKHAISLQQCSPLCRGFPLSAPQFEGKASTEGPVEQSNGLSCKCNGCLQALQHPCHQEMETSGLEETLALPLQLQQSRRPRKLINQILFFCT